MSATASESCSTIVFIVKVWHTNCTARSPYSSFGCESLQSAKGMMHFLRIDLMWSLKRFFCPPTLLRPSLSWPWSTQWGNLLLGNLMTWPNQRSWRWRSMDSIVWIPAIDLISEWITLCHQRSPRINWRRLMRKDSSSLIWRRHGTHVLQPCKLVEMTTELYTLIFVWIVRFWLPDTRLHKRPKADETRLMHFLISFVRSTENERFEPKYV